METLIVTGAAGLLGSSVVAVGKNAGYDVIAYDRVTSDLSGEGIIVTDLANPVNLLMEMPHGAKVIHLAGIPRPSDEDRDSLIITNTQINNNVFNAAIRKHASLVVYASSYSLLGPPFGTKDFKVRALPIDEHHVICPSDPYSISKFTGELLLDSHVSAGLLTQGVSLRFPWIVDCEIYKKDIAPLQDYADLAAQHLFAYIDVRDAAEALIAALDVSSPGSYEAFYVAALDTFMDSTTAELVEYICDDPNIRMPDRSMCESIISSEKFRSRYQFQATTSWRDY